MLSAVPTGHSSPDCDCQQPTGRKAGCSEQGWGSYFEQKCQAVAEWWSRRPGFWLSSCLACASVHAFVLRISEQIKIFDETTEFFCSHSLPFKGMSIGIDTIFFKFYKLKLFSSNQLNIPFKIKVTY